MTEQIKDAKLDALVEGHVEQYEKALAYFVAKGKDVTKLEGYEPNDLEQVNGVWKVTVHFKAQLRELYSEPPISIEI